MSVLNIFSKRARRAKNPAPDVFQYDVMPNELRVQTVHMLRDAIGEWRDAYWSPGYGHPNGLYTEIHNAVAREHGVFELAAYASNSAESIFNFILGEENITKVLDIPETAFRLCEYLLDEGHIDFKPPVPIGDVIAEFNERCREAAFGYAYESGRIIRVDSALLHQDVIKPALALLHDPQFSGANEEFLLAHEHYRHRRHKEAIVEALKSFESTIKTIAAKRKWRLSKTPNAKALIDACFSNGLIDPMLESYLTGVRTSLESGLPTTRNQVAGHGQGQSPTVIPEYLAAFAINQAATCIAMLVAAHTHKK